MSLHSPLPLAITLLFMLLCIHPTRAQYASIQGGSQPDTTLSGDWRGTVVSAQGLRFQLLMHLSVLVNGPCTATYDIVDQQLYGRHFTSASYENGRLLLNNDSTDAAFEGEYVLGQDAIIGVWKQARTVAQVRFQKVRPMRRIQEPSTEAVHPERAISIPNREHGLILGGTLLLPDTSGSYPLIIFVSDKGHQDRNATDPSGHRPFLVLAHFFADQGWASLRIDDRGVGESGGSSPATIAEQVSDIAAAVERMQNVQELQGDRIVILGHGEGGLVAAEVARRNPKNVAAVICAGTPSVDGRTLITGFVRASDELYGTDPDVIEVAEDLVAEWYDIASTTAPLAEKVYHIGSVTDSVLAVHGELLSVYPAAVRLTRPDRDPYVATQLLPWLNGFVGLKAPERLVPVSTLTLALLADRDVITPFEDNMRGWKAVSATTSKVDIRKIDNVNHGFQPCEDCTAEEAARSPQTVAPEVLRLIVDWATEAIRQR